MYLIGINNKGFNPLGSDSTFIINNINKAYDMSCNMIKYNVDIVNVYMINDYSQRLCEMEPIQFSNHIIKYGTQII